MNPVNRVGFVAVLVGAFSLASAWAQFETRTVVPTLQSPSSIAVDDFNRDGKQDVAVASRLSTSQISVFLGNGDGTLRSPSLYAAGSDPVSLATADFNGDGNLDLVVADYAYSNNVNILLGKGDGTFSCQHPTPCRSSRPSWP
jgi:hypothetical protein